jgi:hypothetical protein
LYADATMRVSCDMKLNVPMPPGAAPQLPFKEILTRVKGDRSYASMGPVTVVSDLASGKITLIDPKTQRFATMPLADYLSKVSGSTGANTQDMPEQAKQILAKTKFDLTSRDTGRTNRIQGIEAYERELVVSISIPVPIPGQENGMQISLKFQIWKPQAAEMERVPALRELAAYSQRNHGIGDFVTMLRQAFRSFPGMGDNAAKMMEEMTKDGNVVLGMHMEGSMPGLAKMMEQARANGEDVPNFPADKPLAEVNMDLTELSADAIADDVFAVPAGFKEAPMEDLVKSMTSAFTGAVQPGAPGISAPASAPAGSAPK